MAADEVFEIGESVGQAACHGCGNVVDVSKAPAFSVISCPHCKVKLAVPARLGEFLLLKVLGKGTMGAAYKAYDRVLGRHVAIKVMRKSLGDDVQLVDRFLGEARALAALNHRHVIQIYSLGKDKGRPYLVMELARGAALRTRMAAEGAMAPAEMLQIAIAVAQGLQAAHGIGLIHGDVKPANILFGDDGTPKLVDFGLARFGGVRQEPGEGMGTPFYVAPERVRQEDSDHRGDIYSLGATIYHAVAGEPPFDAETVRDVLLARLRKPAPDIRTVRGDVCPALAAVVAKMLAKDPAERHQTYDELLADLHQAAEPAEPAVAVPKAEADLMTLQESLTAPQRVTSQAVGNNGVAGAQAVALPAHQGRRIPQQHSSVWIWLMVAGLAVVVAGIAGVVWYLYVRGGDRPYPDPGDPSYRTDRVTDPLARRQVPSPAGGGDHANTGALRGAGIHLAAESAEIEGDGAEYEAAADKRCIGKWHGRETVVGWEVNVNDPGEYFVDTVYACQGDQAGGAFTVELGMAALTATVEATGGWSDFRTFRVGKVNLAAIGLYQLRIKGKPKEYSLMNLRSVNLVPVR